MVFFVAPELLSTRDTQSSEEELQQLTRRFYETAAEYDMEISSEKSKIPVTCAACGCSHNLLCSCKFGVFLRLFHAVVDSFCTAVLVILS